MTVDIGMAKMFSFKRRREHGVLKKGAAVSGEENRSPFSAVPTGNPHPHPRRVEKGKRRVYPT